MRSWPTNSSSVRGRMRAASGSRVSPENRPDCRGAVMTLSALVVRLQREGVGAGLAGEVGAGGDDVRARLEEGHEHGVRRVPVVVVLRDDSARRVVEGQVGVELLR